MKRTVKRSVSAPASDDTFPRWVVGHVRPPWLAHVVAAAMILLALMRHGSIADRRIAGADTVAVLVPTPLLHVLRAASVGYVAPGAATAATASSAPRDVALRVHKLSVEVKVRAVDVKRRRRRLRTALP